jgi:hypothetical protein
MRCWGHTHVNHTVSPTRHLSVAARGIIQSATFEKMKCCPPSPPPPEQQAVRGRRLLLHGSLRGVVGMPRQMEKEKAQMGTFAETANVDFYLSFANQGKETSVFQFRLQQTNKNFPFSVFCLQQTYGTCRFLLVPFSIYIYPYVSSVFCIYTYIRQMELIENGNFRLFAANGKQKQKTKYICCRFMKNIKRKTEAQVIFLKPFTLCSSCK